MSGSPISRRELLVGAGTASLGALTVGAENALGARTTEYNVGTAGPAVERAARDAADQVTRVIDWGNGTKTVTGRFSAQAIESLRRRADVRYVEENGDLHAIGQTLEWGVDRIDAEVAHANGETGGDNTDGEGGADIAIIDTGIDSDHPDLQANLGKGKAFVSCKGGPKDCRYAWDDDNDHGTHCAGIADAIDNTEGVVGVSTTATLHAVKVLDQNGSGSYSDVAAGIEWVADQGYDVGSMSLGGGKSQTVEDAVEYAYGKGVYLVAAAGNDGPCSDCVSYPAAEPKVVAVSATSKDDSLASFSSTGSEVELAAPGENIYSTVIGGYDTFSGTSMACPHVSGAGGQLMDNDYSNTQARDKLNSKAEDIGLSSNEQGNGLVDVAAALGLDSSDDLSSGNSSPAVDSLTLTEVETSDSDAEFDADWQVSDSDGNLETVDLTLTDDTDGGTEDTASINVSGDTASGTTRLVASGDDGSGNSYTVDLTVTDTDGATASDSASATESESTSSAPTVDSLSLPEDNKGGSPHAEFTASWGVSDGDGDLDTVDLTLTDLDDSETEDSASLDVSGSSASGTTSLRAKHEENSGHEYEVEAVVTDTAGNTDTATASEIEDGGLNCHTHTRFRWTRRAFAARV